MKKISKILVIALVLVMTIGCGNMMDTPTKKVESLLNKYQTLDKDVITQLDEVVSAAGSLSEEQQEKYRDLMKRQYKNLTYKIKDEVEDGDSATVIVEIQVFDYGKAISDSENYLIDNRSEFIIDSDSDTIDSIKYLDYKLGNMASITDKVTYTISFTLTKKDNEWKLNDLNDIDRMKLHGLYY